MEIFREALSGMEYTVPYAWIIIELYLWSGDPAGIDIRGIEG